MNPVQVSHATYEYIMSHIWMSHVAHTHTHTNQTPDLYEWKVYKRVMPHMNMSCHVYEWVTWHTHSHIRRLTCMTEKRTNESCHIWMCHVTYMNESRHTHTHTLGACVYEIKDCNILQLTATHCNTLQHTATNCNSLQHPATHCNTLQHTATHCNTPQHTATHRNTQIRRLCIRDQRRRVRWRGDDAWGMYQWVMSQKYIDIDIDRNKIGTCVYENIMTSWLIHAYFFMRHDSVIHTLIPS